MTLRKLGVAVLVILMAGPVFAGDEDGLVGPPLLQFSFSNPGARSMGFGGAFVALADDATAAFANPAGLVQVIESEFTLELRRWNYSTPYVEGGRIEGDPSVQTDPALPREEARQAVFKHRSPGVGAAYGSPGPVLNPVGTRAINRHDSAMHKKARKVVRAFQKRDSPVY